MFCNQTKVALAPTDRCRWQRLQQSGAVMQMGLISSQTFICFSICCFVLSRCTGWRQASTAANMMPLRRPA